MNANKWMVTRARLIQPKKQSGTLYKRTGGDTFDAGTAYANIYIPPTMDVSGLGGSSFPTLTGDVVMFQEGEAAAPSPDDKLTDEAGNEYQIFAVKTSLNFVSTYAVHRCTVTKIG